jgi:hypothetical protein
VNNSLLVQLGQGKGQFPNYVGRISQGAAPIPLDRFRQCLALDERHRKEGNALRLADVEDRAETGMVEARGGLRLPEEPNPHVGPVEGMDMGDLQSDLAFELAIEGEVNATHPASAEKTDDLVAPEGFGKGRFEWLADRLDVY